jgi:hypothetical protein
VPEFLHEEDESCAGGICCPCNPLLMRINDEEASRQPQPLTPCQQGDTTNAPDRLVRALAALELRQGTRAAEAVVLQHPSASPFCVQQFQIAVSTSVLQTASRAAAGSPCAMFTTARLAPLQTKVSWMT